MFLIFVIYIIVYCIFKHRDYISHNSQIVCICLHTWSCCNPNKIWLTVRLLDVQIVLRIIRNLVFIKFQVRRKTNRFVKNGYTTSDVQVIFPKTQAFSFVLLILNHIASSETYRYLARTIFTTFVSTCYF